MDRFLKSNRGIPTLRNRWLGLVLGLWTGASVGLPLACAEPVFTNKGRFRIPYQLDDAEIKRLGATEIQLHVSTDNGRTWRHVDSVPPVEGKFTFDAAGDGEYSFAVRTVDRRGDSHPAGPLAVSLQVTVDTTAPSFGIDVEQSEAGRVQVRWNASDSHLDADSLVLEHRDGSSGDWQPMSIKTTPSGQTSWSLADGGMVEVRGTIRDAAGNEAVADADATIEKAEEPVAAPVSRPRRQPIADTDSTVPEIVPDEKESLPTINPEVVAFNRNVSSAPDDQPPVTQPRWDSELAAQTEAPLDLPPVESPVSPPPVTPPSDDPAAESQELATAATPPATDPLPTSADSESPPLEQGSERRVSSTTFEIAYQLDDVGPSGVSSVDLYLTENGGEKWFHYGGDLDHRSPFQVTVPDDGTYGFAIRAKSGVGLTTIPPQPNDPPELTIIVDRQPPQTTLLPVQQEQGGATPQLLIGWKVTDEALPEKPVELSYSKDASGPWESLNGWQSNSGQYTWDIGPNVPPQVYVRLAARDAAGNTAQVVTEEPIIIDLSKPTARFLDVESIR